VNSTGDFGRSGGLRTYRNEVGNGAGRLRGRVEPEVAAVAREADAERQLARRRGRRAVHGGAVAPRFRVQRLKLDELANSPCFGHVLEK
jgi:hypothetical protein